MSLDFSKTPDILKLGLTDPVAGWQKYFAEGVSFKDTALVLTGPLILLHALLVGAFGDLPGMGFLSAFFSTLLSLVIGVFVGAGVFSFLAGVFEGQGNFDKAFSAVSLAWVPALLGGMVAAIIPYLGFLVAIAAAVLSLVYLYRLLPVALGVPDGKRVWHFILGLLTVFVINFIVAAVLGLGRPSGGGYEAGDASQAYEGSYQEAPRQSGMAGAMQRQGEIMETAGTHRYDPPSNGRVNKAQVAAYVEVQRKARKAQERFREKMQKMEQDTANAENQGLAGLTALGATISGAVSAGNAEMEIVVTGGGNWAEHNWVKGQLQAALIHGGEGQDPIPQNYALFEPYLEELGE
ncbi:MAG: YIP1 family protein [Halioglobus sp.]|nr:YIP1 family protein [Halioglobus sp.]